MVSLSLFLIEFSVKIVNNKLEIIKISAILLTMKRHLTAITVAAIVLLFFPFLALPEFWATLFVIIPALVIVLSARWIQKNVADPEANVDSLELYIEKLQNRFRQQKKTPAKSQYGESGDNE